MSNIVDTVTTAPTATAAPTVMASAQVFRFFAYDSKQNYPAPDRMRLVTATYRAAKAGEKASKDNAGIFIPDWISREVIQNNLPLLMEYFQGFLQGEEDKRIKELHKVDVVGMGEGYFKLESLLAYMEETGASGRLSGEAIAEWYTLDLQEAIIALYQEKGQSEGKAKAIADFVGKKLQELASPKTNWNAPTKEKLLPLLEAVKDSAMGSRLIARIERMQETAENMLDAL